MINENEIKIECRIGNAHIKMVENISVSYGGSTYMIYRENKKGSGEILHFSDYSNKELKKWVVANKRRLLNELNGIR